MAAKRGQSTIEYSLLFVALAMGLIWLKSYLGYAVQGHLNDARWQIAGGASPFDAEAQVPLTHYYSVNSNENYTSHMIDANINGLLFPAVRRDVEYNSTLDFKQCETTNAGVQVTCP